MIPKIIHYCWFGDQAIPENYAEYIKEWKKFNPDYKIMQWDESNSPIHLEYIKNAKKNSNWANMANLTRFYALLKYGGIYLDTDMKLIKPLNELLSNKCFLGFEEGQEGNNVFWVNNAVIGAVPEHKFIKLCYDTILERFDGTEAANLSAPVITTELLKEKWNLKNYGYQKLDDVTLYPKEVFYPIHYNEVHKVKEYTKYISDSTIGIHMWARTWFPRELMLDLIDNFRQGNIELLQIVEAKRKECEIQEAKIAASDSEITELTQLIEAKRKECEIQEAKIAASDSEITELTQLVEDIKDKLAESKKEYKTQEAQINLYSEKIAAADAEIKFLNEEITRHEISIQWYKNTYENRKLPGIIKDRLLKIIGTSMKIKA